MVCNCYLHALNMPVYLKSGLPGHYIFIECHYQIMISSKQLFHPMQFQIMFIEFCEKVFLIWQINNPRIIGKYVCPWRFFRERKQEYSSLGHRCQVSVNKDPGRLESHSISTMHQLSENYKLGGARVFIQASPLRKDTTHFRT